MDALVLAVLAAVPNFAGFVLLFAALYSIIKRLFDQLEMMIKNEYGASVKRIILLEAKTELLESLIGKLLEAFKAYPEDLPDDKTVVKK